MSDPYNKGLKPTVTFDGMEKIRLERTPAVEQWGRSNLPDGDYVYQYRVEHEDWWFYRREADAMAIYTMSGWKP